MLIWKGDGMDGDNRSDVDPRWQELLRAFRTLDDGRKAILLETARDMAAARTAGVYHCGAWRVHNGGRH